MLFPAFGRASRAARANRLAYLSLATFCLAVNLAEAANPTQIENARAGTTAWQLTNPATSREIEGYASLTSVGRGGQIRFFVNTAEASYTLRIFRMGWYGGAGAREMTAPVNRAGTVQPLPTPAPGTGLIDCNWSDPYPLTIPSSADSSDWASGVYLAQLTAGQSGKQSYIPFVVRDDARAADYLFQSSVTTYQAYNNWGGRSLYPFNSGGVPARKVSFNRPYAMGSDPQQAVGVGAGEFLTNLSVPVGAAVSKGGWEYSMVRFLEREGYDVTYCTDVDTHADPNLLLSHKGFLAVGHDEYWTWQMRSHVEWARDHGVSLGFFGANTCYWQTRLETSAASGEAHRVMACYKDYALAEDPLALDGNPANDHLITRRWRETPINKPEDALVGVMYETDPVNADLVITNAAHWICAGTGLSNGDALPGLVGYEVDRYYGNAPGNTVLIAHSPYNGGTKYCDMAVYTAASGATVFAAGSMQWSWGLDNYGAPALHPALQHTAAQQMTRNVLAAFLAPAVVAPPPVSQSDDFNNNMRDPARWAFGTLLSMGQAGSNAWDTAVAALEQNQRLEIFPRAGSTGLHYNGFLSPTAWDLTNAGASVEVVRVAGGTADTQFALCRDPQNGYAMVVEGGMLYFSQLAAGSRSTTSVTYNATLHRFWRIRHDPGPDTIVFETSADRATWTPQRTLARQIAIAALKVELSAGTYQPVSVPGSAIFDDFRLEINAGTTPNVLPVANAGGPYSGTAGRAVLFDGSGSADPDGTILAYQWSFGDGSTGTGAAPTHTYSAVGSYLVTLTVTDNRGGTGMTGFTLTVAPAPPPPPAIWSDDFDDSLLDLLKWGLGTLSGAVFSGPGAWDLLLPVVERNGRVEIAPRAGQLGDHYNGYLSTATWDLTDAAASVEVVQVAGGGTTDTQMALCLSTTSFYLMEVESGRLYLDQVVAGVRTSGSVSYNPTLHRFWRMRHDALSDTVLFETSPDRITWTIQRTVPRQVPVTALRVELSAGTWEPIAAPGTAIFDNFRLDPNNANQPPVANPGGPYTGTIGQAVTFDGAGSADLDGTITGYLWDFGDGATGTGATASHTYATAGTYPVTLTVTDNRGAATTAGTTVSVALLPNQPPVANAGGPYTGTTGHDVTFDGRASTDADGTLVEYRWDFGDGTSGTGANPAHRFTPPGTYTVTLTVTDDRGGTHSATTTVTIAPPPNQSPVARAGGPYTGTVGSAVTCNGSSSSDPDGTIAGYQWDFGDGTNGTGANPGHAYGAVGTYTVTLTVTDDLGGTNTATTTANVTLPPNQPPVARPGGPYTGTTVQAVALSGSTSSDPDGTITGYQWNFGDNTTGTGATASHVYATAGTYTVTLTVTDNRGGTHSATTTVAVSLPANQLPVSRPGGPYTGTTGQAIALNGSTSSDPDGTITSYQWSFGDNTSGTGATPSHSYATAGTYTVTLTVTDNRGGTKSATTTATISLPPNQLPISRPGGPYTGTTGQAVALNGGTSSDLDGTITTYQWNFGDSTTGTGATPSHVYATAGTYTVTLTVTDNRGGTKSATTTATIALPPNQLPVSRPGGPYSGTTGQAVAFNGGTSSDPDGTITGYQWNFGDNTTGTGAAPTHSYASAGTYTVTLTVTDNRGGTKSATTTATIALPPNQLPVANPGGPYNGFAQQAITLNGSGSSDPDGTISSYQWNFGDGTTGSGITTPHTYPAAGTYTVTLTVRDNRGGTKSASTTVIMAPPCTAVSAPSNLSDSRPRASEVQLNWRDNSGNEVTFRIERSTSSSSGFVEIASVGANTTSYRDTSINRSTTYYYRVRAVNACSASGYTATVTSPGR